MRPPPHKQPRAEQGQPDRSGSREQQQHQGQQQHQHPHQQQPHQHQQQERLRQQVAEAVRTDGLYRDPYIDAGTVVGVNLMAAGGGGGVSSATQAALLAFAFQGVSTAVQFRISFFVLFLFLFLFPRWCDRRRSTTRRSTTRGCAEPPRAVPVTLSPCHASVHGWELFPPFLAVMLLWEMTGTALERQSPPFLAVLLWTKKACERTQTNRAAAGARRAGGGRWSSTATAGTSAAARPAGRRRSPTRRCAGLFQCARFRAAALRGKAGFLVSEQQHCQDRRTFLY